jgi:hypothetical protein
MLLTNHIILYWSRLKLIPPTQFEVIPGIPQISCLVRRLNRYNAPLPSQGDHTFVSIQKLQILKL